MEKDTKSELEKCKHGRSMCYYSFPSYMSCVCCGIENYWSNVGLTIVENKLYCDDCMPISEGKHES